MWTKLSEGLDVDEIKRCVKILVKEFLQMEVQNIVILGIPTYEDAELSYNKNYAPYVKD